jgi:hypothetical protein
MENALCKLIKKYRGKKLKKLCDVDSDPLMINLSSSWSLEAARFLAGIFRNSPWAGGGILKRKCWLCLSLNIALNPKSFPAHCSPSHPDELCNLSCILFHLGQVSMLMCFVHFGTLCKKCLVAINIVVSCLMKCQSERMYISIKSLTALWGLRIVEVGAGHAKLQIML